MSNILVTGGTGSFGRAFSTRYQDQHTITVFSRDELKQHEMRQQYPNLRYEVGDVRDRQRIGEVMKGQDYVFHAAALKQVPSCEFFPLEAVKTNILGTDHVLDAARANGVRRVVCLSTDKAVYPINAMGISKAMMERVAISKGAVVTRYGNVMKSRGSIIPIWQEAARVGAPLLITNPDMTRFLLSLEDSIDLVWYAMQNGEDGDTFVKKAPACTMETLADAIGGTKQIIGIRHGEKIHESLISSEEMLRTIDEGDYYRIKADSRNMNYDQYFNEGRAESGHAYTSENTRRLNKIQVQELL
jgi:UDP-N-acetylglucosamine 4,6-dehydratase